MLLILVIQFLPFCAFTLIGSSINASAEDPTSDSRTEKKISSSDNQKHTNASTGDPNADEEKLHAMESMVKSLEHQLAIAEQKGTQLENHLRECQHQLRLVQREEKTEIVVKQQLDHHRHQQQQQQQQRSNTKEEIMELKEEQRNMALDGGKQGGGEENELNKNSDLHLVEYPALANSIQFGQKRGISPCDDFYKFVCSGQDKLYKEWGYTTSSYSDHYFSVKKEILEILFNNNIRAEMEQKIGGKFMANGFIYYDKCLNKRREARETMKKRQHAAKDEMPPTNQMILDDLVKNKAEFTRGANVSFADLLNATPNALPMLQIKEEQLTFDKGNEYALHIVIHFETRLLLRKAKYNGEKGKNAISTKELELTMLKMYKSGLFGKYSDRDRSSIKRRINDMLDIEYDFIIQLKAPLLHRVTLGQLNTETGSDPGTAIDWVQLMERRFPGRTFDTNTQVVVNLARLKHWYNKIQEKLTMSIRKQAVIDYMNWHLLLSGMGPFENMAEMYTNWWNPLEREALTLDSLLGKKNQPVNRQGEDKQFCLKEHLLEFFPHVVDRMIHELLSKKIPVEQSVVKSEQILHYVRRGFEQMLADKTENNVMDEKTRENGLRKLRAMQTMVGFLPDTFDDQKLDGHIYGGISLNPAMSWLEMLDQMLRHKQRRKFAGELNFVLTESLDLMEVSSWYHKRDNQLFIKAMEFLEPSFNLQFPNAYNFGAIGHTMGHEITHGFDTFGRQWNWKGVLMPEPGWWTETALEEFNKRKQCLQQQYRDYEIIKYRKNVDKTIDEDIADNGGLHAAYKGWQLFNGENSDLPEKKIAHVDVEIDGEKRPATPEQLFFIGYAFSQCRVNTCDKTDINKECDDYDVHSIDRVRVNVPLRIFEQFHRAFQCPLGTPMHPEKSMPAGHANASRKEAVPNLVISRMKRDEEASKNAEKGTIKFFSSSVLE